jgi:threonine synthase
VLEALGLLGSARPRMYCVQSRATQPLVAAWDAGAADTTPVVAGRTLATGLNVPGGVGHFRVLEIIRASGGAALAVDEAAIAAELARVWRTTHEWLSPEGAACLAALPELLDRGAIRRGERIVAVNTGSLEKYLPDLRHLLA